jgi:hypothetical protein
MRGAIPQEATITRTITKLYGISDRFAPINGVSRDCAVDHGQL